MEKPVDVLLQKRLETQHHFRFALYFGRETLYRLRNLCSRNVARDDFSIVWTLVG